MCGFGIQLNGVYPSHSVILILEAPKATWMALDGLDGCSLVRDLPGPNFLQRLQVVRPEKEDGLREVSSNISLGRAKGRGANI